MNVDYELFGIGAGAEELRGDFAEGVGGRFAERQILVRINIFYRDEDEGYIADIPDLEACSAFGRTPTEALVEVQKARRAWWAAARKEGKPVPPPNYRPAIYQLAS